MRLLVGLIVFFAQDAMAYQSSLTPSESKLRWSQSTIPLRILNNSKTINPATSQSIIQNAISQWNSSMSSQIQPSNIGFSQIRFESDFSIYGSAVVGVTELNFSSNGIISSANIFLNEENYQFSTTPGFSGVFLGDVVTHELGHFLGLAHSEVLDSSMFYANFPGQSSVSSDDKAAVRSKYSSGYGKIFGYVKGGGEIGILGVHVQAVASSTGEIISTFSNEDGYFEIGGLPLGETFYIYTSPMKNSATLPGYYANVQSEFCPGSFVGSFYSACGNEHNGIPQPITPTNTQRTINIGVVSINCSLRTQDDYNFEKVQSVFDRLNIYNFGDEGLHKKSYVGYFRRADLNVNTFSSADRLQVDVRDFVNTSGTPKYLRIQIVSQALGNPVEYSIAIRRNGSSVLGSPLIKDTSADGVYLMDSFLMTPLSNTQAANIFEIDVKAKRMPVEDFSLSIPDFVNFGSPQHWPYLITLSIWDNGLSPLADTGVALSDNVACLDAPFAYSVDRAGVSSERSPDTQKDPVAAAAASCGTIGPPSDGGPGSSLPLVALGFFIAMAASSMLKRKKNFLS